MLFNKKCINTLYITYDKTKKNYGRITVLVNLIMIYRDPKWQKSPSKLKKIFNCKPKKMYQLITQEQKPPSKLENIL